MTDILQTDHFWITLPGGERLAARRWQPATEAALPAIVEYIPYRKGDLTAIDDARRYQQLAADGFVCIRVDVRGSGDSEGILTDEYTAQELEDGYHVVEWVARQRWCNGRVGLAGISWGGFNALQIAALRPPSLAAVISCCSTDDRYRDDVHYVGDSVLAFDMLPWASTFQAYQALPPDPKLYGADWHRAWRARLTGTPHFVETWLGHTGNDGYWQHGSIASDYGAIECPVLLVGGWADAYTNGLLRMSSHLTAPTWAIIGPWGHNWPDAASPGPRIGFAAEAARWWQHWLGDADTGVDRDPRVRYFLQQAGEPGARDRAGMWCEAQSVDAARRRQLHPSKLGLVPDPATGTGEIPADAGHGASAGDFCPFGARNMAGDQAGDDSRCLVFDSATLEDDLIILGRAQFCGELGTAGQQIIARLCELRPDGTSLLVSRGYTNAKGAITFDIEFDAIAHRFTAGSKIRLALATTYWPFIWPAPEAGNIMLDYARSCLELPVAEEPQALTRAFPPREKARGLGFEVLSPPAGGSAAELDDRHHTREDRSYSGDIALEGGPRFSMQSVNRYTTARTDPLSAEVTCERQYRVGGPDWQATVVIESRMSATATTFHVKTRRSVFDGDVLFDAKVWEAELPRGTT